MLTASGSLSLDLLGALHVDVEQKVVPFFFRLAQKPARGAVVISEDVGMLQKFVVCESSAQILRGKRSNTACRSARCPAERRVV